MISEVSTTAQQSLAAVLPAHYSSNIVALLFLLRDDVPGCRPNDADVPPPSTPTSPSCSCSSLRVLTTSFLPGQHCKVGNPVNDNPFHGIQ